MKRLHVHVSVDDLAASARFYSTLFAAEPAVAKSDYVKWMLDDPRVNFAISTRGGKSGLDHLGIQVETKDELHEVYDRLQAADRPVLDQGATNCCYAQSEKSWITDPQGLSWETFLTDVFREAAFVTAFRYLKNRITVFTSLPIGSIAKVALGSKLREIGHMDGSTFGRPQAG